MDNDNHDIIIKGQNRDRRREDERKKQVVHTYVPYLGHRAGRKADQRRLAQTVRQARKKG